MVRYVLHVYAINLGYAQRYVRDLSDDQMCAQPHGLVNHPAWSLGHLAAAADRTAEILGLTSELPAGWRDTFKTGGIPSPDKSRFPGRDEIVGMLSHQHARVAQALSDVSPDALQRPNPHEHSRGHFPTVGDFAIFLMTAHEMDHLGQLAAWRRAMGLAT